MSQREKRKFTNNATSENLSLSLENEEISLAEPVSVKDNHSSDKFEALYSGRFADVKKEENDDKDQLQVSKHQRNDDIALVLWPRYLNQNTAVEPPNFQDVCSDEISLDEPVSLKGNIFSNKFEAPEVYIISHSGRFADVQKNENGDKTLINVSKQQNDGILVSLPCLNQNTRDESSNFQNVCSDETVRTDLSNSGKVTYSNQNSLEDLAMPENNTLIIEAKKRMGDKILLEFNNLKTVDVARNPPKSDTMIQTKLAPNDVNTKIIADDTQRHQETVHPHYQEPTSNVDTSCHYLDANSDVAGRIFDEHGPFNNRLQVLADENPGESTEGQSSEYDVKISESQQFMPLEFDYNLLSEDLTPYSKNNEHRENNYTSRLRPRN